MRRFGPTLLLALPFVIVLAPHAADSWRTIDVTMSRSGFPVERIEVVRGEPAQLKVVSADGTHGFQVKKLGLHARVPAGGSTVTIALTPEEVGTFEISSSAYCDSGDRPLRAWLIVRPGT